MTARGEQLEGARAGVPRPFFWRARAGQANYSLCHGSADKAGVLGSAARVFGDDTARLPAEQVGHFGLEQYRETFAPWDLRCPRRREPPGLLSGLAGIGHFYLRLHDPAGVPSVLIILTDY